MNTARYKDGTTVVTYFDKKDGPAGQQQLADLHAQSLSRGPLVSIEQRPVTKHDVCPCGSGMKYHRCKRCRAK